MGSMTENIADKAINDTRIVKQFTNPVKEPIDSDINLFDLLDNRAKRDPEGAMIEYKGDDGTWHPYSAQVFRDMVIDLAKGLVGLGVNKGDSVAIVSRTRWGMDRAGYGDHVHRRAHRAGVRDQLRQPGQLDFQRFQSHARHRRR